MAFVNFALIASFGIGNMVQANSVVDGLGYLFPEVREFAWLVGLLLAPQYPCNSYGTSPTSPTS